MNPISYFVKNYCEYLLYDFVSNFNVTGTNPNTTI
jgi:hypothetical protein